MSTPCTPCAAPGCDNPVTRRPGQPGRPPIYCSPACRPSHHRRRPTLTIELEHDTTDDAQPGREWIVRLRRGGHSVDIRDGLGRLSATTLATELHALLPADVNEVTP